MTSDEAKKIVDFMLSYKGEILIGKPGTKAGKAARKAAGLPDKKHKPGDKTTKAAREGAGLDDQLG